MLRNSELLAVVALFYKIVRFVQGARGFRHVQLMNDTLLEML